MRDGSEWLQIFAQRPQRRGHQHLRPAGLFAGFQRQPHPGPGHRVRLVFQAKFLLADAIGAESVCFDQVRAGLKITAMDGFDQIGLGEIDMFERLVEGNAASVNFGAHGAVAQQRSRFDAGAKVGCHNKVFNEAEL